MLLLCLNDIGVTTGTIGICGVEITHGVRANVPSLDIPEGSRHIIPVTMQRRVLFVVSCGFGRKATGMPLSHTSRTCRVSKERVSVLLREWRDMSLLWASDSNQGRGKIAP